MPATPPHIFVAKTSIASAATMRIDEAAAQQGFALHRAAQQPAIAEGADHIAEHRGAEEEAIGLARQAIDLDQHEGRGREHNEQPAEDAGADQREADAARIA